MFRNGFGTQRVILLAAAVVVSQLTWAATVHALDPTKAITQYIHDVWTVEQGLPSNNVSSIIQTRDGYLWFGTHGGGLARFDGVRFTVFDQQNTPAIKSSTTDVLDEDGAANLWIITGIPHVRLHATKDENEVAQVSNLRHTLFSEETGWSGTRMGDLPS